MAELIVPQENWDFIVSLLRSYVLTPRLRKLEQKEGIAILLDTIRNHVLESAAMVAEARAARITATSAQHSKKVALFISKEIRDLISVTRLVEDDSEETS